MNSSFKIIGTIAFFNVLSIFGMLEDIEMFKDLCALRTKKCSLRSAVAKQNFALVKKLLKEETIDEDSTILFAAETVKMARLLIKNGANVYVNYRFICGEKELFNMTLLERIMIDNSFEPKLVSLYCQYDNELDKNKHLLHECVKWFKVGNEDNSFKKIKLLCEARPFLINTLNAKNKTPLDKAERLFEKEKKLYQERKELHFLLYGYEKLCVFLKEKGAKTALALQQEHEKERKQLAENVQTPCIVCFELKDKDSMKIVPCAKAHLERLCTDCLTILRKRNNMCPLCREQLR